MKKLLFLLFVIVLSSCEFYYDINEKDKVIVNKIPYIVDNIYVDAYKDWNSYSTFEQQLEAINLDEMELYELPTDSLTKICFHHPMYGLYMAYNNEFSAINILFEKFNGFKVLFNRTDAGKSLINYYQNYHNKYLNSKQKPNPIHLGYIELVLSSDKALSLYSKDDIEKYKVIKDKFYEYKKNNTDDFSDLTINKSYISQMQIDKSLGLLSKTDSSLVSDYIKTGNYQYLLELMGETNRRLSYTPAYTLIRTKFGKEVDGWIVPEMSRFEKDSCLDWVTTNFPLATVLSDPTAQFNCHNYAWNWSDGGGSYWINEFKGNGNSNVHQYWNRDYYSSVNATSANALKIFYPQGDHSAIPAQSGNEMYISKWGKCPIMLHASTYCPYHSSTLTYFKVHNYINDALVCSIWNRVVNVNEQATYSIRESSSVMTPIGSTLSYSWEVLDNKHYENVIGSIATLTNNGRSAVISFNRPGTYEITCHVSMANGQLISSYICETTIEAF